MGTHGRQKTLCKKIVSKNLPLRKCFKSSRTCAEYAQTSLSRYTKYAY